MAPAPTDLAQADLWLPITVFPINYRDDRLAADVINRGHINEWRECGELLRSWIELDHPDRTAPFKFNGICNRRGVGGDPKLGSSNY